MSFELHRDAWGRLELNLADGRAFSGVELTRAFPIQDPSHWLIFTDAEGREILCLESIDDLSSEIQILVDEELRFREFMPEVSKIVSIRGESPPSTWNVLTNHGPVSFTLDNDDDVRMISSNRVIITDIRKLRYQVSDISQLDPISRRVLERYL